MRAVGPCLAWWLAFALYLAFCLLGLPDYGATWDELENLYAGETQLHFLASGEPRLLDYSRNQLEGNEAALYWEYSSQPQRYPAATNILAAGFKHVLSDMLGWLHPLDGYHSAIVMLASLLVASVIIVAYRRLGALPALTAGLALGLHPRFFSDLHNNIKDVPEAVWYSLALLLALRARNTASWRSWAATGLALGLALATKPNALMWPLVVGLWLLLEYQLARPREGNEGTPVSEHNLRATMRGLCIAGGIAVVTAIACWPWLWAGGLRALPVRIDAYFDYLKLVSTNKQGFSLLAPLYLLIVTPPWVLALSALGIVKVVRDLRQRSDRDGFGLLLLVWLSVPLLRLCLPRARFYDGIRHFIEVLPALALLAAIGTQKLSAWLARALSHKRTTDTAIALVAALGAALPIALYHPHENLYFNALIGGYGGARDRKVPWAAEYWSGSLREAVEWIDSHGERGFRIVALNAGHLLATLSVRPGLVLEPDPDAAKRLPRLAATGQAMRYYAIETRDAFPGVSSLGRLVHERLRDGEPVFRIYRIERQMANASAPQATPKGKTVRPLGGAPTAPGRPGYGPPAPPRAPRL